MKMQLSILMLAFSLVVTSKVSATTMPMGCAETTVMPTHGLPYFNQQDLNRIKNTYQGINKIRKCRPSDIRGEIAGLKGWYQRKCSSNPSTSSCISGKQDLLNYIEILNKFNSSNTASNNSSVKPSKRQSNEGAVAICYNSSTDFDQSEWTIALGKDRDQAERNRDIMMPYGCEKNITCEGGYFAMASSNGWGDGIGFSCGHKSRAAAVAAARIKCSEKKTSGNCLACITGKTTNESKQAKKYPGHPWQQNSLTRRSCQ